MNCTNKYLLKICCKKNFNHPGPDKNFYGKPYVRIDSDKMVYTCKYSEPHLYVKDTSRTSQNVHIRDVVDKSTFSFCQLNLIEWLGIESK